MSNVTSCSTWRLYVIVDAAACGAREPAWVAEQAIRGGADVIQLRHKAASAATLLRQARELLTVTRPAGIPLIINDRADVAAAAGADGVHVGQDDLPVAEARKIVGPGKLVGQSTHSLEQAIVADINHADYIAVGPLYPTPTKPDSPAVGLPLIREVRLRVEAPIVCIGGIDHATLPEVVRAGARCVAVVRAVCAAPDPAAASRSLKSLLPR